MLVKVALVDANPQIITAWQDAFAEEPDVVIVRGSIIEQHASAWASPTDDRGNMSGGLGLVIKSFLGADIEQRLQRAIEREHGGALPLGHALAVPTGDRNPRYLITTPLVVPAAGSTGASVSLALAVAAALQAVNQQNLREPGSVRSVALTGFGDGASELPPEVVADLMWTAYRLFREAALVDFAAMGAALEAALGDLGPTPTPGAARVRVSVPASAVQPPPEVAPLPVHLELDDPEEASETLDEADW